MTEVNLEYINFILIVGIMMTYKQDFVASETVSLTPATAEGFEGDNITLTCSYSGTNAKSSSRWFLTGVGSSVPISLREGVCTAYAPLNDEKLYEVNCINSETFSVTIKNVQRDIHGNTWTCEQSLQSSNIARLVVNVAVTSVSINSFSKATMTVPDRNPVDLSCVSSASRPSPTLDWTLEMNASEPLTGRSSLENVPGDLTVTHSNVSFIANRRLNGIKIYCHGNNYLQSVVTDWTLLNITYAPDGPPSVQGLKNGSVYAVIEGEVAELLCLIGDSNPPTELSWICDTALTPNGTYANTTSNGITWQASRKLSACNCSATHISGPSGIFVVNINVLYPPEEIRIGMQTKTANVSDITNKTSVLKYEEITLSCSAGGNPLPSSFSWSGLNTSSAATLRLVPYKDGNFTCTATNTMVQLPSNKKRTASASRTFGLEVLYPPSVDLPKEVSVIEGQSWHISCNVTPGNPSNFKAVWESPTLGVMSESSELTISNITKQQDADYTCSAGNTMITSYGLQKPGNAKEKLHLFVLYPPENLNVDLIANEKVYKNISTMTSLIENNSEVVLNCSASGNPAPSYFTWTGYLNRSRLLRIPLRRKNAGNYTCLSRNEMHATNRESVLGDGRKTYHIVILYPPNVILPEQVSVIEGQNVNISSKVTPGNPQITTVTWKSDVDGILSNSRTLLLKNVTRDLDQNYTCLANNTMAPTYGQPELGYSETSFHLSVLYPPENISVTLLKDKIMFSDIFTNFSLTENTREQVLLECTASGNPPVDFIWTGPRANDSSWLSLPLQREVTGEYTCNVGNNMTATGHPPVYGRDVKTYSIVILYPTEIKTIADQGVEEGKDLSIRCEEIPGRTTTQSLKWLGQNTSSNILSLSKVNRSQHGVYTCVVNSTMKPTYGETKMVTRTESFLLNVLYKAEMLNFGVVGKGDGSTVDVTENETVTFVCKIGGNPDPNIELIFEKQVLSKSVSGHKLQYNLNKVGCFSYGVYSCTGNNYLNNLPYPAENILLYVKCAPRLSGKSHIEKILTSELHDPVTLSIKFVAYPSPTYRWLRMNDSVEEPATDGRTELTQQAVIVFQFTFSLDSVREESYGEYKLIVKNLAGHYEQKFCLQPKSIPAPPTKYGYYAKDLTSSSAVIWWEPNFDGGYPQTFYISCNDTKSDLFENTSVADDGKTVMTWKIIGLQAEMTYSVVLYVGNQLGSSRVQEDITFKTKKTGQQLSSAKEQMIFTPGIIAAVAVSGAVVVGVIVAVIVLTYRHSTRRKTAAAGNAYVNQTFDTETGCVTPCRVVDDGEYATVKRKSDHTYVRLPSKLFNDHNYDDMPPSEKRAPCEYVNITLKRTGACNVKT